MNPTATPGNMNQANGFHLIHTDGNSELRSLGPLGIDKCRWWTIVLQPVTGSNPSESTANITAETVKPILVPRARNNHCFSILRDIQYNLILVVFHSKRQHETALHNIASYDQRPFCCLDIIPLDKLEPDEVRDDIDARLGDYLEAVLDAVPEPSDSVDGSAINPPPPAAAPQEVDASVLAPEDNASPALAPENAASSTSAPTSHTSTSQSTTTSARRPSSRRGSRSTRKSACHDVHSKNSDESAEMKSWRDANSHIRDIVINMTLIYQNLRDLPAIATVLAETWEPSGIGIDSALKEAVEQIIEGLPEPAAHRKVQAQLETAMKQAAVQCGIGLSLEIINIDDSSGEED